MLSSDLGRLFIFTALTRYFLNYNSTNMLAHPTHASILVYNPFLILFDMMTLLPSRLKAHYRPNHPTPGLPSKYAR